MGAPVEKQATDELKPGEQLIWQGRPASLRGKQRKTEHTIVGTLVGLVFISLFLALGIARSDPAFVFCTTLFVIVALVSIVRGRHTRPYRLARTIYVVSDRRIFILRTYGPDNRVQSLPFAFLGDAAVVSRKPDGRGAIRFSSHVPGPITERPEPVMFHMVEDAANVLDLVEQARR